MDNQPTRMVCGNNPTARLTEGDRQAVADFRAYLAARAALARIQQMADHWEQHLPEVIRTPAVVSALRAALETATPSASPLPVDRATVLREAEKVLRAQAKHYTGEFNDSDILHEDGPAATVATWKRAAETLRRMADEAQPGTEASPDVDPVYDPRAWETYRRDAGCGCTAPAPVDCKIHHGTGAWLCVCHRLSGPPMKDTDPPGTFLSSEDEAIRRHFTHPNRCLSAHAGIFRCERPTGHPGGHRQGRTFWARRPEDDTATVEARQDGAGS